MLVVKRIGIVVILILTTVGAVGADLIGVGASDRPADAAGREALAAQAQLPPDDAARQLLVRYPETVLLNGHLLTMDRDTTDFSVAEAMAIRDGKIMAVGTTAQVRALAGPRTAVLDFQGRTVIPGIVDTHLHIHEYAPDRWLADIAAAEPDLVDLSPVRIRVASPDDALAQTAQIVAEREPGRWVQVHVTPEEMAALVRQRLTLQLADQVAPNNPLLVRGPGAQLVANSLVLQKVRERYGDLPDDLEFAADGNPTGRAVATLGRMIQGDVLPRDPLRSLGQAYQNEMQLFATAGVTTWSSSITPLNTLMVISEMDREGRLPIRFAYTNSQGSTAFPAASAFYPRMGDVAGQGTDMLWNIGMSPTNTDAAYPTVCTTLTPAPTIKARELCYVDPDNPHSFKQAFTFEAIKARQRLAGTHSEGDKGTDAILDAIEGGSAAAGMTLDEIRAKRHALDHCSLNPRPDQIQRMVRLGMLFSCDPKHIVQTSPRVARDYGPNYVTWISPVRSIMAAGGTVVYESDSNQMPRGPFATLKYFVTRTDDDGNVWVPEEAVDRRTALLTATRWAARYVLRENVLGSLEPGKWADLVVLDQDYDAVPDEDLGAIEALATMVGGKWVYQAPNFP